MDSEDIFTIEGARIHVRVIGAHRGVPDCWKCTVTEEGSGEEFTTDIMYCTDKEIAARRAYERWRQ